MEYTNKYFELRKCFNLNESRVNIDETMEVINLPFNSKSSWLRLIDEQKQFKNELPGQNRLDSDFFENNHFTYPVFVPKGCQSHSRAIVMLHGLNERHWDKYLPWAYYLSQHTRRPVILFPIAFHMNRGPMSWINAKELAPLLIQRKTRFDPKSLTYANVALSERLTEDPLRFMKSGQQTAEDLLLLLNQIKTGLIPIFEKDTHVDFFAYSIGAFVAQIMFLADYRGHLNDSKLFLFCGGAFFNEMNGVSRLIMDDVAFQKIKEFYTTSIDTVTKDNLLLNSLLTEFPLGKAFYAMLKEDNHKNWREETFRFIHNQIYALTLKQDRVIPALGTEKVLRSFEIVDFPYEYSHEVPFPVNGKANSQAVDDCFNNVFFKAGEFLA